MGGKPNPQEAILYTRKRNKQLLGISNGVFMGKISENSSGSFFFVKEQELKIYKSGRLYMGINDDNKAESSHFRRFRNGNHKLAVEMMIKSIAKIDCGELYAYKGTRLSVIHFM